MKYQISNETLEFRKKLNSDKIYFRDIIPTKQVSIARLSTYRSTDINLKPFEGKLYDDPYFGQEMSVANTLYSVLKGDWLLDEEIDEATQTPIIKLTDNKSGQFIKIAFPDQTNKLKFLNEMVVSQEIKQENPGMRLDSVVNKNILYPKKKDLIKLGITSTIIGIGIFTFLKKKNKQRNSIKN